MRRANDAYMTPEPVALAITRSLAGWMNPDPRRVLEPSAGAGSFVKATQTTWPGTEIVPLDLAHGHDFMRVKPESDQYLFDLVLGNPPFSLAEGFVQRGLEFVPLGGYVAYLLRLSFLGSYGRLTGLFKDHPLYLLNLITPRPTFTGGGNDYSEYGLFVWQYGYRGNATIGPPIFWRDAP